MAKNAVCIWFRANDPASSADKCQGHGDHCGDCKHCPAAALTTDGRFRRAWRMDARACAVRSWTFSAGATGMLRAAAFPSLDLCFFAGFSVCHDLACPEWCAVRYPLAITASAWAARARLAKGCFPAAPERKIRALIGGAIVGEAVFVFSHRAYTCTRMRCHTASVSIAADSTT